MTATTPTPTGTPTSTGAGTDPGADTSTRPRGPAGGAPPAGDVHPAEGEVLTERQRRVWGAGDYRQMSGLVTWVAESLVHEVDVHAGERVLDVAAGNGNVALAAARRGAHVLATDLVPQLLEAATHRARAEGVPLRTQVADAQGLPLEEGGFDVVLSAIGAMFAPDQEATAAELARVCRSGGRIGLASWTPDSMPGELLALVGGYAPTPPRGPLPTRWGTEDGVRALLAPHCAQLRVVRRTCPFRAASVHACTERFTAVFGPLVVTAATLDEAGRERLRADVAALLARHDTATDGTLVIDAAYLEVVAVRR